MKSPITADSGAMLNAYPDSMGGTLADIAALLAVLNCAALSHLLYSPQLVSHRSRSRLFRD